MLAILKLQNKLCTAVKTLTSFENISVALKYLPFSSITRWSEWALLVVLYYPKSDGIDHYLSHNSNRWRIFSLASFIVNFLTDKFQWIELHISILILLHDNGFTFSFCIRELKNFKRYGGLDWEVPPRKVHHVKSTVLIVIENLRLKELLKELLKAAF